MGKISLCAGAGGFWVTDSARKPIAPRVEGGLVFFFSFVLFHASNVVVCCCVYGGREGVKKVSVKEREHKRTSGGFQGEDGRKMRGKKWSWMQPRCRISQGSVVERVCMCMYTLCVCVRLFVCILWQENLSPPSLLWWMQGELVRGERAGGKASHPLCSFILLHLFNNLLFSRHSQDLNDPYAAESTGSHPIAKVYFTEEKVCSPYEVCVCILSQRIPPQCPLARYLCLVNPLRAPSHGIFILLSVVSLLSLRTHTHTLTNAHTHAQ